MCMSQCLSLSSIHVVPGDIASFNIHLMVLAIRRTIIVLQTHAHTAINEICYAYSVTRKFDLGASGTVRGYDYRGTASIRRYASRLRGYCPLSRQNLCCLPTSIRRIRCGWR